MQITKLTNTLKPITLSIGMAVAPAFLYSSVDDYSKILTTITDSKTREFVCAADNDNSLFYINKLRFNSHFEKWFRETAFMSSVNAIVEHPDFQAIVAMQHAAVPYIVETIEQEPSNLVWTLNFIYKRKISDKPNLTISEACKLWVRELKKEEN